MANVEKDVTNPTKKEDLPETDPLMTEQLRKLRTALAYQDSQRPIRSVLITSCLPDEGKTTVSLNLSIVLASGVSSSVILIDADLRRRSLTSSLGLNGRPGLANLLAGDGELKACLLKTQVDNLLVLPAGSRVQNPAELIASVRMRTVLQELKEQHESAYVIIDSTPIVSTSEPNVLTELVDGVVLVIRAERTRRDIVKRELEGADLRKILGVVLNGADFEASQYYRKYYTYEPNVKR
jgi:capsular exopolysaccharide synthesis family protein